MPVGDARLKGLQGNNTKIESQGLIQPMSLLYLDMINTRNSSNIRNNNMNVPKEMIKNCNAFLVFLNNIHNCNISKKLKGRVPLVLYYCLSKRKFLMK